MPIYYRNYVCIVPTKSFYSVYGISHKPLLKHLRLAESLTKCTLKCFDAKMRIQFILYSCVDIKLEFLYREAYSIYYIIYA